MSTPVRIVLKALVLFVIANLLFAAWVEPRLGRISAYNAWFPGRPRFPFGESPREAYNFSLFDLDAMFAAHEVSAGEEPGEYRVFVTGDSSVWGTLLRPEETLTGQLNALKLVTSSGQPVVFYNLGYPTISLTKDLLLLDRARQYRPDLVIWLVTLEAFPVEKQLEVPLVANNPFPARDLLERYRLASLPAEDLVPPGLFGRTIIGRRKDLADLIRLQMYGVLWAGTGIDQLYPADYPRAQVDLDPDPTFHGKESFRPEDLAFEVIEAGQTGLGEVPLLVVNEPILISEGENSDIRYNFYYPRWAYDRYRDWLGRKATALGWEFLDAWNIAPVDEFTNSAIHLDRSGTARLAETIAEQVREMTEE